MTDLTNAELATFCSQLADRAVLTDFERPLLREAARRLAAPENEDENGELAKMLFEGGTMLSKRGAEHCAQMILAAGYRKRPAPDAVQAFAAELVRWCEEMPSGRLQYPFEIANHIRSMAEGRHE